MNLLGPSQVPIRIFPLDGPGVTVSNGNQWRFEVFATETGRVQCTCAKFAAKDWCNHVLTVLTDWDDAKSIEPNTHILVPLFNSEVQLEVTLSIGPNKEGMLPVFLPGPRERDISLELGYLMPNEGRMVLREMVIELLRSQYKNVDYCWGKYHSDYHFGKHDKRISDLSDPTLLASIYFLMTEKKCYYCVTNSDDVVPDIGGR